MKSETLPWRSQFWENKGMCKAIKVAATLSSLLLIVPSFAQDAADWTIAKQDPSAGAAGIPSMPPITAFPGQGAGNSGSPIGNALGTAVGAAAAEYQRGKAGQKCREVHMEGGAIPEC